MDISLTYTNPVLPQNSPDPGALALPDGSGEKEYIAQRWSGSIRSYPQGMHWSQRPILHTSRKETLPYLSIFPLTWYVCPPNSNQ